MTNFNSVVSTPRLIRRVRVLKIVSSVSMPLQHVVTLKQLFVLIYTTLQASTLCRTRRQNTQSRSLHQSPVFARSHSTIFFATTIPPYNISKFAAMQHQDDHKLQALESSSLLRC